MISLWGFCKHITICSKSKRDAHKTLTLLISKSWRLPWQPMLEVTNKLTLIIKICALFILKIKDKCKNLKKTYLTIKRISSRIGLYTRVILLLIWSLWSYLIANHLRMKKIINSTNGSKIKKPTNPNVQKESRPILQNPLKISLWLLTIWFITKLRVYPIVN